MLKFKLEGEVVNVRLCFNVLVVVTFNQVAIPLCFYMFFLLITMLHQGIKKFVFVK